MVMLHQQAEAVVNRIAGMVVTAVAVVLLLPSMAYGQSGHGMHADAVLACAGPERVIVESRMVAVGGDDYPAFLACLHNHLPGYWKQDPEQGHITETGAVLPGTWTVVPSEDDAPPLPAQDYAAINQTPKPGYLAQLLDHPILSVFGVLLLFLFLSLTVQFMGSNNRVLQAVGTGALLLPLILSAFLATNKPIPSAKEDTTAATHMAVCVEAQHATLDPATRVITGTVNLNQLRYCLGKAGTSLVILSQGEPSVVTVNINAAWVVTQPARD